MKRVFFSGYLVIEQSYNDTLHVTHATLQEKGKSAKWIHIFGAFLFVGVANELALRASP